MKKSEIERAIYVVESYIETRQLPYTVEQIKDNFKYLYKKYYLRHDLCMACNYLEKELTILTGRSKY